MSKNSGIGHVWAANVGEDGRPNGVGPVWIENISAIGGGGGGSIPSEVSGKWEDASNCVESNSAAWDAGSFTGVSAGVSLTGNGYDIPLGLNTPVVMQNNESTASYNQYGMSINDGNGMQTLGIDDIKNWNSAANTVSANSSAWNDSVRKTYGVRQRIDMGMGNYIDLGLSDIANTPGIRVNQTTLGQNSLKVKYQNGIIDADNNVDIFGSDISVELKNNKNNVSSKLTNIALTFNSGADTASLDLYDISALKSASGGGALPASAEEAITSYQTNSGNYLKTSEYKPTIGRGLTGANFSLAVGSYAKSFSYGLAIGEYTNRNVPNNGARSNAAIGYNAHAYGTGSQAFGEQVVVSAGMAIGKFNQNSACSLVIGNGSADTARSDSFIVYYDGSVSAAGNVSANGHELPIVEYVSNSAAATGANILYVVTGSN